MSLTRKIWIILFLLFFFVIGLAEVNARYVPEGNKIKVKGGLYGVSLDRIPLKSYSRFTDTFQENITRMEVNDGGVHIKKLWQGIFVFNVQEVNRQLIANNASGLYYNVTLNASRTSFGDWILSKGKSSQMFKGKGSKYFNLNKSSLNRSRIKEGFMHQNKFKHKDYGKAIPQEKIDELISDFTDPPVVALKGRLISSDFGDFNLLNNTYKLINVVVAFNTSLDWQVYGVRLKFGHSSVDWSLETTLTNSSQAVYSVAFSPDNNYVAYGTGLSVTGHVYVHTVSNWAYTQDLTKAKSDVLAVAFSPNSDYIAYGSVDNHIYVHNVSNWALIANLTDSAGDITSVAFSPDGTWLAGGSADDKVYIYKVADWSLNRTLTFSKSDVNGVAFSYDSAYLAYSCSLGGMYIVNLTDWSLKANLTDTTYNNLAVAFSQDNSWMAYGSTDNKIYIYKVADWSLNQTITNSSGDVRSVDFSANSRWMAYASSDWKAYVQNTDGWALETNLSDATGSLYSVAFSQDNKWLASSSYDTIVYLYSVPGISYSRSIGQALTFTEIVSVTIVSQRSATQSLSIAEAINVNPSISNSSISPSVAYTNNDLIGYCKGTDPNGDTLKYYYRWYRNGLLNSSGNDSGGNTQGININIGNISSVLTARGDNWTLSCLASDGEFNSSWVNSTVKTIANSAPSTPSLNSPSDSETLSFTYAVLNYTASDIDNDGLTYYVYGDNQTTPITLIYNGSNSTFNFTSLTEGKTYYWRVQASDGIANSSFSVTRSFSISSISPAINIDTPVDGIWYTDSTLITFNFTATDQGGVDVCSLYGNFSGTWAVNQTINVTSGVATNFTPLNLSNEKQYKINIWCNDTSGNGGYALSNITFGVDTINPQISISLPEATTYHTQTVTLDITATDTQLSYCSYYLYYADSMNLKDSNTSFDCTQTFTLDVPYYTGGYNVTTFAYDLAGNNNHSDVIFTTEATPNLGGGGGGSVSYIVEAGNTNVSFKTIPAIMADVITTSNKTINFSVRVVSESSANLLLKAEVTDPCGMFVKMYEGNKEINPNKYTSIEGFGSKVFSFVFHTNPEFKEGSCEVILSFKDVSGKEVPLKVRVINNPMFNFFIKLWKRIYYPIHFSKSEDKFKFMTDDYFMVFPSQVTFTIPLIGLLLLIGTFFASRWLMFKYIYEFQHPSFKKWLNLSAVMICIFVLVLMTFTSTEISIAMGKWVGWLFLGTVLSLIGLLFGFRSKL